MSSKRYGYARVSSREQNLDRQLVALSSAGVDARDIITDKQSGKDFARPGWELLTGQMLRRGDTLVIKELDRMGRDWTAIKSEWQKLTDAGVDIEAIDQPMINTGGKTDLERRLIAAIVLELLAYLAQKEREKIKTRQAEGIAAARAAGKPLGRVAEPLPANCLPVLQAWRSGQITAIAAAAQMGVGKTKFYQLVKEVHLDGE